MAAQAGWAAAALRTAFAISVSSDSGKRPISSLQQAGFRFSKYFPPAGALHWPAMKFAKFFRVPARVRVRA